MLTLEKINTYYGDSHILHDVSLRVKKGEIVALLGRNGVGKTTTMRTIMGLTPPKRGTIVFAGKPVSGLKSHQIARRGIGLVPEERWIFPTLTVHQNLLIGMRQTPTTAGAWSPERCYETFPSLNLRKNAKGRTLSGGEQQMLTIARTLMGSPRLMLIDEPTEGLAPKIVDRVAEVVQDLNREGIAVLLVEQKLAVAMRLAHRIYVMSKGVIRWEGTPEALAADETTRRQYLEV